MITRITTTAAMLMRIRRVRRVTVASSELPMADTAQVAAQGTPPRGSDARRTSCALTRRVGADRRTGDRAARRVDPDLVARDGDHPVVETTGRRATLLLADPAVLRPVARAL